MKKTLFIFLLGCVVLLTGCSGIMRNKHYEIIPEKQFYRTTVSDWIEDITEPTFGILRPPLYTQKDNDNYYIFYPVVVEEKGVAIGPAFLPIIPFFIFPEDVSFVKKQNKVFIRCWNESHERMSFPKIVALVDGEKRYLIRRLSQEFDEKLGFLLEYQLPDGMTNLTSFVVNVTLQDERQISAQYNLRRDTWVAPFFSFNEPPIEPFVKIKKKHNW